MPYLELTSGGSYRPGKPGMLVRFLVAKVLSRQARSELDALPLHSPFLLHTKAISLLLTPVLDPALKMASLPHSLQALGVQLSTHLPPSPATLPCPWGGPATPSAPHELTAGTVGWVLGGHTTRIGRSGLCPGSGCGSERSLCECLSSAGSHTPGHEETVPPLAWAQRERGRSWEACTLGLC